MSDNDPPEPDSGGQGSAMRSKTPTAKALDLESGTKLQQMVISNDLMVSLA